MLFRGYDLLTIGLRLGRHGLMQFGDFLRHSQSVLCPLGFRVPNAFWPD